MSTLDDKLIEWLNELQIVSPAANDSSYLSRSVEINRKSELIAGRIKAAFADSGYVDTSMPPITVYHDDGTKYDIQRQRPVMRKWTATETDLLKQEELMTGQKFYDRFIIEYHKLEGGKLPTIMPRSNAATAAKRASGIAS